MEINGIVARCNQDEYSRKRKENERQYQILISSHEENGGEEKTLNSLHFSWRKDVRQMCSDLLRCSPDTFISIDELFMQFQRCMRLFEQYNNQRIKNRRW